MSFSLRAFCSQRHIGGSRWFSLTSPVLAQSQRSKAKKPATPPPAQKKMKKPKVKSRAKIAKEESKKAVYAGDLVKLPLAEAINILRCVEICRPTNTYELVVKTAMPRGAPIPKGRLELPHEFQRNEAKRDTILVFCERNKVQEALDAGADIAGGMELVEGVASGKVNADIILSTPALIGPITRPLGRVLGPRGMMPSTRRGTVLEDVVRYIKELKGGSQWRGDKRGTIRTPIGKLTFDMKHVEANVRTFIDSVKAETNTLHPPIAGDRIDANKPRNPITKVVLSSTQGPGISLSDVI